MAIQTRDPDTQRQNLNKPPKCKDRTYGWTSCLALVSIGSRFLAMFPEPPRPVVTTDVLSVGVCRSWGWILGDLALSTMLPAPPRPLLAKCPPPPIVAVGMSVEFGEYTGQSLVSSIPLEFCGGSMFVQAEDSDRGEK